MGNSGVRCGTAGELGPVRTVRAGSREQDSSGENITEHERTGENENNESITESGAKWARYFDEYNCCMPIQSAVGRPRTPGTPFYGCLASAILPLG